MRRIGRNLFGFLVVLSALWLFIGLFPTENSTSNTVFAFICTGLPVFLFSLFMYIRIGRSIKRKNDGEDEQGVTAFSEEKSGSLAIELQKAQDAHRLLKAQYENLEKLLQTTEQKEVASLQNVVEQLKAQESRLQLSVGNLTTKINMLQKDIIQLDETILLQSFGIYEPQYNLGESSLYKARLDKIRDEQKQMIKENTAASSATTWSINGSATEGKKMIADYVKLILRSFNNECDATITNTKYNNVDSLEKKIRKAAETLNKLGERMSIIITNKYVNLKIQELYLSYEYELKKQAEKEEQQRIREIMREEEKVIKELEKERAKLEKEIKHFNQALVAIDERIASTESDDERAKLESEKANIQQELAKVTDDIANNDFRANNTRAGHVYVISNIGSFGENVYKIGVTRRLIPQERVDELGDASVPFRFDVHAMIFSEDAPRLENALHKAFEHKRLNFINTRREFFKVSLDEIQSVVRQNFNKPVDFIITAAADEYRQSEQMRRNLHDTSLARSIETTV